MEDGEWMLLILHSLGSRFRGDTVSNNFMLYIMSFKLESAWASV